MLNESLTDPHSPWYEVFVRNNGDWDGSAHEAEPANGESPDEEWPTEALLRCYND